ncbi:hypothetical protein HU730_021825 [Pseudomonas sp. SWRI22]|uniref:hypothetical protein n=1 Tax=Pseudomonas sp. SWRI22 TaxID=2745513 RepID=UPI001646E616|nr:hypothetical protein [Pseudomonas sp. SWRI22]MBV4512681.1 hypothetical protein [Pseudomonas sp. SWRI22]
MTNQTIDGVMVLRAAVTLVRSNEAPAKDAAIRELRALLDAPACKTCCDQGEIFVSKGKVESHMLTEPDPIYRGCPDCKPAAQPQDEPVACAICLDLGDQCLECEEAAFVSWANRHFASADYRKTNAGVYIQDWMRSAFAAWQARKSEQPAPVAVALPERRDFSPQSDSECGWNTCLDELKRLNPSL